MNSKINSRSALIKRISPIVALFLLIFHGSGNALDVNFDDITTNATSTTPMPENYQGLIWDPGWGVINDAYYKNIYNNTYGAPSAPNAAYNGYGVLTIKIENDNSFDFNGAFFAGWSNDDIFHSQGSTSITIEGYKGGNLVGVKSMNLLGTGYQWMQADLLDVDELRFVSSGDQKWWLIDNLTINESWKMPLSEPTIQQDFNCYDCYDTGNFHAGLDMTSASPKVTSARSGVIHAIYLTQDNKNTWCDGTKNRLSELPTNNEGFGNAVILRHENTDGTNLYTQMAHLNCISKEIGVKYLDRTEGSPATVALSEYIGNYGASGTKKLISWAPHLHFEIKNFGKLSPTGKRPIGYTASLAENAGYLDPMVVIHRAGLAEESYRHGIILENDINIRVGPGQYPHADPLIPNKLNAGTEVVITRTAYTKSGTWYQVNLGLPPKSYTQDKDNIDNNSPDGWVHSDYVAPYYGFTTTIKQSDQLVDVYDDSKKTFIAKVVSDQTFPVIGVSPENDKKCVGKWLKLSLGVVNLTPDESVTSGWICSSNTNWGG